MMQLLKPKVEEIQEKYKDDPDTQQRLLAQLYGAMDVNPPLGVCVRGVLDGVEARWLPSSAASATHLLEPHLRLFYFIVS